MPKVKIICSEAITMLKDRILQKIDEADIQAEVYREQIVRQQQTKGDSAIITASNEAQRSWLDRSMVLHEVLCDIKSRESEVEI